MLGFDGKGASDAGGTEKPFHRAAGLQGALFAGLQWTDSPLGLEIVGAGLARSSLASRRSEGGLQSAWVFLGASGSRLDHPRASDPPYFLRAGFMPLLSDPMGLLYSGYRPAVHFGYRARIGQLSWLGLEFLAMDLSDDSPYFARGYATGAARYYETAVSWWIDRFELRLSHGVYDLRGRSALPEGRFMDAKLWEGQQSRPDQYIHYSGLGLRFNGEVFRADLQAYQSWGQLAQIESGVEEFLSRKTVRGWLVALRTRWILGEEGLQDLGASGLGSSRNRKDGQDFHGFAPLSPQPTIMGGYSSIFLTSRPAFDQSHSYSNRRFFDSFPTAAASNEGRIVNRQLEESGSVLTIPDHANRGIRMGGLEAGLRIPGLGGDFRFFLNRAEFRESQGTEGILQFSAHLPLDARLVLGMAGASVVPAKETPDPYTGFIPSSKSRYFSRYSVSLFFCY